VSALRALAPGLHRDIPSSVYHERIAGYASKSALDLVRRSPAHYKAWLDGHEEEPTPALVFGSAFHCALLEPKIYASSYVTQPDFGDCRKTANRDRRDAWRAENAGKIILPGDDAEAIVSMVASVRRHPLAGRMITDGDPELTVVWDDPETGLRCKGRADYYVRQHGMLVDVKTALNASASEFRRSVANLAYHVQDAFYRTGFASVGAPVQHFVFVAVEKELPYAVAIYALDVAGVAKGHAQVREDLQTLARCTESNTWPAYPAGIQDISLPAWAA